MRIDRWIRNRSTTHGTATPSLVALAEELHFTRAASACISNSHPCPRAIKELEDDLGVPFERNRRGTVLTEAGATFLQDVRRVFAVLKQAQENVQAVAAGLSGSLRIAVSDGAIDPRLSALRRCREEELEIEIRLSEVPLADQLRGLRLCDFSTGLRTAEVGDDIVTEPLWHDPLVVAVPARHPYFHTRLFRCISLRSTHWSYVTRRHAKATIVNWRGCCGLWSVHPTSPSTSSLDMMLTPGRCRLRGRLHHRNQDRGEPAPRRGDLALWPSIPQSRRPTLLRPAGEDSPVSVERSSRLRAHSDD